MYYQFDYQKIIIWNLRYEQVAFLDADMVRSCTVWRRFLYPHSLPFIFLQMIGPDPGSIFRLCGTHPMCAVQDPGAYGGYFNNGLFVTNVKWEIIEVCSFSCV